MERAIRGSILSLVSIGGGFVSRTLFVSYWLMGSFTVSSWIEAIPHLYVFSVSGGKKECMMSLYFVVSDSRMRWKLAC